MKELTHEEWIKTQAPRIMWVWDEDETCKEKMKVIYVSKQDISYPVVVLDDNDLDLCRYKHCAEITKTRRMTNKEFSIWLRENPTREFKNKLYNTICFSHSYNEDDENEEVSDRILVRENGGKWREPLAEVQ